MCDAAEVDLARHGGNELRFQHGFETTAAGDAEELCKTFGRCASVDQEISFEALACDLDGPLRCGLCGFLERVEACTARAARARESPGTDRIDS